MIQVTTTDIFMKSKNFGSENKSLLPAVVVTVVVVDVVVALGVVGGVGVALVVVCRQL